MADGTTIQTLFVGDASYSTCTTETRQWLFETLPGERRSCPIYSVDPPVENEFAMLSTVALRGAFAWTRGADNRYKNIDVWERGAPEARPLTNCNCVTRIAGGDDVLFWARFELPGVTSVTLWESRAPFRDARRIWEMAGGSITSMAVDPNNPRHLVFAGGRGDDFCPSRSEIYYYDAAGTEPPRQLTRDDANQLYPIVRGDLVAFSDLAADTINPNGCFDTPHDPWQLRVLDIRTGRSAVANEHTVILLPQLITDDRLYLSTRNGFGYAPMPALR